MADQLSPDDLVRLYGDNAGAAWLAQQSGRAISRQVLDWQDREETHGTTRLVAVPTTGRLDADGERVRHVYLDILSRQNGSLTVADDRSAILTRKARELLGEVADLLSAGETQSAIAARLGVTQPAIANRLKRAAEKILAECE